jgi:hypothetical protein
MSKNPIWKREATKAGFYLLLIYHYILSVSANIPIAQSYKESGIWVGTNKNLTYYTQHTKTSFFWFSVSLTNKTFAPVCMGGWFQIPKLHRFLFFWGGGGVINGASFCDCKQMAHNKGSLFLRTYKKNNSKDYKHIDKQQVVLSIWQIWLSVF